MALSIGSLIQFVIIAFLGYILAGAPLLSILSPASSRGEGRIHHTTLTFDKAESLIIPEKNLSCPEHRYGIHIFSRDPLVVYIEGFLTEGEARHVVGMSEAKFKPSTVWTEGVEHLDEKVRKSEKALLDRDEVVKCIEERARMFQGWRPDVFIEKLWSQRYTISGHYRHHYDWSTSTSTSGRISSFMVYVEANCTGGGTNFPRLKKPEDETWCRFVECGKEEEREGVTFKPVGGNAVFWENMKADGTGYPESWHAGLPVKSGVKIGLNIWSWYQEGLRPEGI